MTDRELLELAAKAAGIGPVIRFEGGGLIIGPNRHSRFWNPLDDDGQALRLAVKLRFTVEISFRRSSAFAWRGDIEFVAREKNIADDSGKAVRRAIVRAAAEIGRAMP